MRTLLLALAFVVACSDSVAPSGSSSSGCPDDDARDPDSGLPVGKNCGLDAGAPDAMGAD